MENLTLENLIVVGKVTVYMIAVLSSVILGTLLILSNTKVRKWLYNKFDLS